MSMTLKNRGTVEKKRTEGLVDSTDNQGQWFGSGYLPSKR